MDKLEKMLRDADIPYEISCDEPNHRVLKYPNYAKQKLSVALGRGTYGYIHGLLETWTGKEKDSPKGWQTAEQAFEEILSIERA